MHSKSSLPAVTPMPLARASEAFDAPNFVYEIKYDGFRALAYVETGSCQLVSRNGHVYKSKFFIQLGVSIAEA